MHRLVANRNYRVWQPLSQRRSVMAINAVTNLENAVFAPTWYELETAEQQEKRARGERGAALEQMVKRVLRSLPYFRRRRPRTISNVFHEKQAKRRHSFERGLDAMTDQPGPSSAKMCRFE